MNVSYVSNPVASPVMVKNGFNAVSTKVIDNKSATGNYTTFSTADQAVVLFVISGTFVADITVYGRDYNAASNKRITTNVIDAITGMEINDGIIKKPGTYAVINDRPYSQMYLRINSYTSGAVDAWTIDGTSARFRQMNRHIVKIAESLGGTISASGSTNVIANLPVDQFAFITFVVRTNSGHAHRVGITFIHPNSLGSMSPEVNIINSTVQRDGETDWLMVKGEKVTFTIHNDDTENSHPYDIVVYGVN